MSSFVELSIIDVALALSLVLIALVVSLEGKLGLGRSILWATLRTVVQLAAMGYLIHFVFEAGGPFWVIVLLSVMLAIAGWTATLRQPLQRIPLYPITLISLLIGAGITLTIVAFVVVRPDPWYAPRYLIPLGGIILGNGMNAVALGLERLDRELREGRKRAEVILALGGSPAQAAAEPERQAVRAALIPVLNSMLVVGLVQLPGIMTGQILAGADPMVAVRYQAVVMFLLLSANSVSTALAVRHARSRYFTASWQLVIPR